MINVYDDNLAEPIYNYMKQEATWDSFLTYMELYNCNLSMAEYVKEVCIEDFEVYLKKYYPEKVL